MRLRISWKLDILVAGKKVDALSCIVHRKKADVKGGNLVKSLKKDISRHMFEISLQAAIGNRLCKRNNTSNVKKMLRRNVTVVILPENESFLKNRKKEKENEKCW